MSSFKTLETDPPTYILNDMNDEIIKGTFYEQELVKYENEFYEIDKIIRREKNKLLVKWKGFIVSLGLKNNKNNLLD